MRKRSNVNWLVLITLCLLITASSMFYISVKNSVGINKCVYSDDFVSDGCVCDSSGNVVCDDGTGGDSNKVLPSEFTTNGLSYSYDFQNYVEDTAILNYTVRFVDITTIGSDLRITVEKKSLCNDNYLPAPQVGFFKGTEDSLILTITTNLVDKSYNIPCVTENIFNLTNVATSYPEDYNIFYQDEYDVLTPSGNCVYEGYLRNEGDTYQSLDGCALCTCNQGSNRCELENSCLQ